MTWFIQRAYFVVLWSLVVGLGATACVRSDGSRDRPQVGGRDRDPIQRLLTEGSQSAQAYQWLETLCLDIGHRLSGSPALERALTWSAQELSALPGVVVSEQPVMVPVWRRGQESLVEVGATRNVPVLGLGGSIGTVPGGVEAELMVVADEAQFIDRAAEAAGKIVLFNHVMPPYNAETRQTGYGSAVVYRSLAPKLAGAHGARAALIRAITNDPDGPPHTGGMSYADAATKVPVASIGVRDAEEFARRAAAGETIRLRLSMEAQTLPDAPSRNVIAELPGRELPNEIVLLGAHIDAWDVGHGAHDDGAGTVTVMGALALIAALPEPPRRTVRVVLFTNEENGLRGAKAYAEHYGSQTHVVGIESDIGAGRVVGLTLERNDQTPAAASLASLQRLAEPLRAVGVVDLMTGGSGADLIPLVAKGVPGIGVLHDPEHYFDYHHSEKDVFENVDPNHLAHGVGVVAALAWALAEYGW